MQVTARSAKSRWIILVAGLSAIVLIALADRALDDAVPLALLYIAPVVLLSTVLRRWQVVLVGVICACAAEMSDAYPWTVRQGIPRDALYLLAYTAAGLYVCEVVSRRRSELLHVAALEAEIAARRAAEEQLRLVVANSSVAIITADEKGEILDANDTAESLYLCDATHEVHQLRGSLLSAFMPSLERVQIRKEGWQQLKTMMQCQGFRANGEPFLADVWFSTYMTSLGGRLNAMVIDSSTETRDREDANLEQVLLGSRLAIGSLSHEIRNLCAAISLIERNLLADDPALARSPDFQALQKLITALERMASVELSQAKRHVAPIALDAFLRDLYVIVSASLREATIALRWCVAHDLPAVWADHQSLLQVFLNLMRNAETALRSTTDPKIHLCAMRRGSQVHISVSDNGPGVADPELLFHPFDSERRRMGLGLYLSRAMMLSLHGDLRYQPAERGATFVVEMAAAEAEL